MKERLKWLCVGVGVMFGMQLLILLIVHNLIPATAPPGILEPAGNHRLYACRLHGRRVCHWSHG